MNNELPPPKKPRVTWLQVLVGVTALLLLASLILPAFSRVSAKGNITNGISNCRQIVMALKLYAADHGGAYPDAALVNPKSANEVFRVLFKEGTIDFEPTFGCPISPFVPDGNIGNSEDRSKALEAGENHWAMTRDVRDNMLGNIPLVFENPVKATWPPMWNPDAKGTATRGRAWSTGIIIGTNDGGAYIQPLASMKGTSVPLKKLSADGYKPGMDLFDHAIDSKEFPEGKVLDVEEKQR
jgi:hypothetical protein